MKNININNSEINENSPTYIIAELSANHNGNLRNALDTIRAAKEIGADAVKIQTYTADTITLNVKNKDFLIDGGTLWDGKNLYELYEEAHTPWEWHKELFDNANEIEIDIFSSPFDKSAVDLLKTFDPPAYKIASFEITDHELISYTASQMKPIIISTGIAKKNEIYDAINLCKEVGNDEVILLKCTSAYPAPLDQCNLKTIGDMENEFGVYAGFSDHTLGSAASIAAVTLGAKVIEKHFILDKKIGGPDSAFSLDKNEFKDLIYQIRSTEKMLGSINYDLDAKKKKNRRFCRSIYVSNTIKKGDKINHNNVKSVRPGYSLHPKYLKEILGKKSKRDFEIGDRITLEDFE